MTFGLPEQTLTLLHGVFSAHPEIVQVSVYGSRAKGTQKPGSDIDLAIVADADIAARLKMELEDLPTPYMFDVTDYRSISHLPLKEHIDRVGKILYRRNA